MTTDNEHVCLITPVKERDLSDAAEPSHCLLWDIVTEQLHVHQTMPVRHAVIPHKMLSDTAGRQTGHLQPVQDARDCLLPSRKHAPEIHPIPIHEMRRGPVRIPGEHGVHGPDHQLIPEPGHVRQAVVRLPTVNLIV